MARNMRLERLQIPGRMSDIGGVIKEGYVHLRLATIKPDGGIVFHDEGWDDEVAAILDVSRNFAVIYRSLPKDGE